MENNEHKGGPKTPQGKDIAKMNALKHGLFSKEVLMDGEDENELLTITNNFQTEFQPETEMEKVLMDRIVANVWRLKRAMQMEDGEVISTGGGLMYDSDKFFRYETMLERGIFKALHELERLQARRSGKDVPLPIPVDVDLSKND